MAVIMADQIKQMEEWTVADLQLAEGTHLEPAVSIQYVHKYYPGGLKGFTAAHPSEH